MAANNTGNSDDKGSIISAASVEKAKPASTPAKYEEIHFVDSTKPVWNYSLFSEDDINNFQNGTHYSAYNKFGNKEVEVLNKKGTYFAVWAPNATYISVIGHFNNWDKIAHPLFVRLDKSGIWEGFIPDVFEGEAYKYHIHGFNGVHLDKGDPYAHYWEKRPYTASIIKNVEYDWTDEKWMKKRAKHNALTSAWSVYEVHLASWMRPSKYDEESYNSYHQITERLVPYVKEMGFTHVELMPVMEHPFDGSWGYQGTGYYAPTSRFGTPQDFAAMVDAFHHAGIGVILDWVPSHFPYDSHGLYMFDGTHTYEYADMRKGFHPDWNSYIFNYKRGEVKSFLISNARFWFEKFHIDGIRVDAVSSMLRLDYSRKKGGWEPNEFGGNGNLEAIAFIKNMNEMIYRDFPDVQTIAEESTDWPGISRPTFADGIGFGMKWMMGWMHDTLNYFKRDQFARPYHQDQITFSMAYFYDENFMLPISHDEVVHGKSPMLYKMPGDEWQKFANLRLLYTYMYTHPGAKLLFMGSEFAQTKEWDYKSELQWELLAHNPHRLMQHCVRDLNLLYRKEAALHEKQFEPGGFEWIDLNHRNECIMVYKRMGLNIDDDIIVILNMLPEPRLNFEVTVKGKKSWKEIFNSDAEKYYGAGDVYNPTIRGEMINKEDQLLKLTLNLPPLAGIILR
ncbi:MAG: 1,4-alpha-glucan branching protein GlgB [Segetibacter sp.]